ncbi:MAG: threonine synthase [Chloroflexi bacterium]|jgi:threonine synthase|nr:threonine synthase [Chloroflexota bacterium]
MQHVLGLKCTICGKTYGVDEIDYICPEHGDDGIVDVLYDYDAIRANISREDLARNHNRTIWRYKPLMPVAPESAEPPLRVGWTPLYAAPRLAEKLGLRHLWVKDDGVNPTASFKDRASAVAVVKAREAGAEIITTASTGNAAAALAGLSASVGLPAVIFVPKSAPEAKIAQHLIYGARVMLVDGTYDDAFELTLKVAREFGWYNRNTAYNPYMTEGKKTGILEICEQLAWDAPDRVFVPVGDGCIIGSVHKGLKDLMALGWIDHMPKIMGVQAEGSSPLVDAWERGIEGWEMEPVSAISVADSIVAGLPRDRNKALAAVRETDGAYIAVSDQEILDAIPTIARNTGVFSEPAAAASYAGLVKAVDQGLVDPQERVVVMLTGSGLKDIKSAMKTVPEPPIVAPNLDAVKALMGD